LPALDHPRRDSHAAYDPGPRIGLAVVLVVLEGGALALLLLIASFWQATTPALARPAQARGLAALTEVDALIALHSADLQRQLDEHTDALTLRDFPLSDLTIDRGEAESASGTLDPAAYRAALLAAGSDLLYERGIEALRAPEAPATASDRLIEGFLDSLTQARHQQAGPALLPTLGVIAVLALLVLLAARGSRLLALGLSLALGGALVIAGTFVARGVLAILGTPPGGALSEYVAVARTLLDLPMWNGGIALGLGLALALPGVMRSRST
jgi:hypothetical protein